MKKTDRIIGISFFALAGLLLVYAIWALVHCHDLISEAVAAGQLIVSGSEYDIMNFYMTGCGQYFIFAALLFGMGWLFFARSMNSALPQQAKSMDSQLSEKNESKEDDFDEWFEETDEKSEQ